CSGDPAALGQCASFVRKGGRVAVIGIPMEGAAIPLQRVVLDEIEIVGVRAAAGEMPEAIALVAAGKIRLGELITHRFPLDDFADAYATFTERRDGAVLLAALFVAALALRPQLVGAGPLLPEIQDDLGVSHAVVGLLGTIPV